MNYFCHYYVSVDHYYTVDHHTVLVSNISNIDIKIFNIIV